MTRSDGTAVVAAPGTTARTEPTTVLKPIGLADLLADLGDWAARVEAAGAMVDATQALHERDAATRDCTATS